MGFEAGGQHELQQVVEFLADKCNAPDIRDRLHVIWFAHDIHPIFEIMNADKVAGFVSKSAVHARNKELSRISFRLWLEILQSQFWLLEQKRTYTGIQNLANHARNLLSWQIWRPTLIKRLIIV